MTNAEPELQLRDTYASVAGRRTAFDNMLWQVPIMAFTAQAFLFTIALSADSSQSARVIACTLAMIISFVSVHLMTRHRQAEIADATWLATVELAVVAPPPGVQWPMHGPDWGSYRNGTPVDVQNGFNWLSRLGGYRVWSWAIVAFGVAALVVLVLAIFVPSTLDADVPSRNERPHHGRIHEPVRAS